METIFTFSSISKPTKSFFLPVCFSCFLSDFPFLPLWYQSLAFFQSFLAPFAMGGTQIFAEFFLSNPTMMNHWISRFQDFDENHWLFSMFLGTLCNRGHPDFRWFFFLSKLNDETLSFKSLMESLAFFNHSGHPLQWGGHPDFCRFFFPVKTQWWNIKFQVFDGVIGFFQSFWAPFAMGGPPRFLQIFFSCQNTMMKH